MKNKKLWIFIGIIVVILVLNHVFGWSEWLRDTKNLAFLSDMVNDHLIAAILIYIAATGRLKAHINMLSLQGVLLFLMKARLMR